MKTIEELIELHRNNFENLFRSRSVSPSAQWLRGSVTTEKLRLVLSKYSNKVGILLYTYEEENLIINLIDKTEKELTAKLEIGKEELIEKINKTNLYFAEDFVSRSPQKRENRGIVIRNKLKKVILKETYEQLSRHLLPFSLENYDHLIIVPTLNIASLPFSAFKDIEDNYLIDKVSYSIAPSIYEIIVSDFINNKLYDNDYDHTDTFRMLKAYDYHANLSNCLLVVNPKYPSDTDWVFSDLPGTEEEAIYIKENTNGRYKELKKELASHENIMQNICDYDLLYFGTHGISDSDDPLDESFLVVAEHPKGKHFLTARDIQDIRHTCQLKASLVVLSACETGLGKEHEGGMIGLARAFQIAGANHTLMSLWSISDQETATLIKLFFKYLKKGGRMLPHEAMRQAILEYKTAKNNPSYWASFSIFGIPMMTSTK